MVSCVASSGGDSPVEEEEEEKHDDGDDDDNGDDDPTAAGYLTAEGFDMDLLKPAGGNAVGGNQREYCLWPYARR